MEAKGPIKVGVYVDVQNIAMNGGFGMQYDVITIEIKQAQEANRQLVSKVVTLQDKNLQLDTQAAVLSK